MRWRSHRDWWLTLQPGADIREFARFQEATTNHFDPAIASQDLERLRDAVARVKKYVGHHLAHYDQNPTREIPTFREIHAHSIRLGRSSASTTCY